MPNMNFKLNIRPDHLLGVFDSCNKWYCLRYAHRYRREIVPFRTVKEMWALLHYKIQTNEITEDADRIYRSTERMRFSQVINKWYKVKTTGK